VPKYYAVANTGVPTKDLSTNFILEQVYCDEVEIDDSLIHSMQELSKEFKAYLTALANGEEKPERHLEPLTRKPPYKRFLDFQSEIECLKK